MTTTYLKTINNQNFQKIKLWKPNNQGVKEETFIKKGKRGGEDTWQGCGYRTGQSHICIWTNQEEQLGNETDYANQGSSVGK